jgi:hypothetical protein
MKIFVSFRRNHSAREVGRIRDRLKSIFGEQQMFPNLVHIHAGADFRNIRQWTCTLWGEKHLRPDARYIHRWKNDLRININANPQIRQVIRRSFRKNAIALLRCSSRTGHVSGYTGLPGLRPGFGL